MQITALVVQRTNTYPGEHAPELAEAVDDITQDDNPAYLAEKIDTVATNTGIGKEYSSWATLTFDIDDDVIDSALNPSTATTATNVTVESTSAH